MNTIQPKIQKYVELPWEVPPINGDISVRSLESSCVLPNTFSWENKFMLVFTLSTSSSYISKFDILDIFKLSSTSLSKKTYFMETKINI